MGRLTRKLDNGRYAQNSTTFSDMNEMMQKLGRLEDLQEAGRLVVMPSGVTGEQLCKIVNACPSILGLKNNCGSHSCESCWEAALKGGGQDE